jgi:Flp pilus assembly protein TadB
MIRILLGLVAALGLALAIQTWRLDRAHAKADRLDTCEEVQDINTEIRNETDDDLLYRTSRPR